ncbi:MAG: hypothetical protein GY909_17750 [Oligoflexia bacterium]|nr:hypothetical protein [Oligoflexia bacterium]
MRQMTLLFSLFTVLGLNAKTVIRGGVDVGNGLTIHHLRELDYELEIDLVHDIKKQLEEIKNGKHPEVMEAMIEGMCKTSTASFRKLSIKEYYPGLEEGRRVFARKRYRGLITIGLKDCLVPEMINSDNEESLVLIRNWDGLDEI